MKKSLFRMIDRFELLICYMLCFGFSITIDYVKNIHIEAYLLLIFLKQFCDYQALIIFLLTGIVVIFHYQMLNRRKKVEVHCRVLVGDTIRAITVRYMVECLAILGIVFAASIIASAILGTGIKGNIYLCCVCGAYILISSRMVSRFENI